MVDAGHLEAGAAARRVADHRAAEAAGVGSLADDHAHRVAVAQLLLALGALHLGKGGDVRRGGEVVEGQRHGPGHGDARYRECGGAGGHQCELQSHRCVRVARLALLGCKNTLRPEKERPLGTGPIHVPLAA